MIEGYSARRGKEELLRKRLDHRYHRWALLEESGIGPEVVVERGYYTAKSKAEMGPACVVFDSDVMINPKVQEALEGLLGFLKGRGARVQVPYLPESPPVLSRAWSTFWRPAGRLRASSRSCTTGSERTCS